VCEEKDDDTQSCHRLSPRTLAEISGVLFKERYLIKPTFLLLSFSTVTEKEGRSESADSPTRSEVSLRNCSCCPMGNFN